MNLLRMTAFAIVTVLAGVVAASPALAQKATTAKKSTTKKTTTKNSGAKKKTTAKTATKKSTKKSASKRRSSDCVGLSKSQCSANKQCGWVDYKKTVASNGRKLTDHCRTVAGIAKKKKN